MSTIERRSFLAAALAAVPYRAFGQTVPSPSTRPALVPRGADRLGQSHTIGLSSTAFKVLTDETGGGLFVMENSIGKKGGPPRHLHHAQDEWFYAIEGDFIVEIGTDRFRLGPGDSVLAPRQIAHAYAFVGGGSGRLLIAYTPANRIEEFFRTRPEGSQYSNDAARYRAYDMELLGPPIQVD